MEKHEIEELVGKIVKAILHDVQEKHQVNQAQEEIKIEDTLDGVDLAPLQDTLESYSFTEPRSTPTACGLCCKRYKYHDFALYSKMLVRRGQLVKIGRRYIRPAS